MRKAAILPALLFAFPLLAQQTSNSLPFTAVTPPAAPVLTSLSGLSASGKIYTGTKMPVIGTGFASGCVVNVDGTAQPSSTTTFVSATEIDYTIPASLGSSAGTSHTLTISCPVPQLTMNIKSPITLPNYTAGTAYSADLKVLSALVGGVPPYKFSVTAGSLPTGLVLSPSGVVSGTPSGAGSFTFSYTVSDASGLAWEFKLQDGQLLAKMVPAKVSRIG